MSMKELKNWFRLASFMIGFHIGIIFIAVNLQDYAVAVWGISGILASGYVCMDAKRDIDHLKAIGYKERGKWS